MSLLRLRGRAANEAMWGYLMISPVIILLLIFSYITLVASLGISFTDWHVLSPPEWVGFSNYINIFQDPLFLKGLWNTARYVLMSIPIGQSLAFILAIILNSQIRFRNFFRLIFFLPVLTMPVAIAVVWKWIYNPAFGPIAVFLKSIGLKPIIWLTSVNNAMWSIVIISVWAGIGFNMVIMLAGLQNIPREYYEAAQVDGANNLSQVFHITIPLLTPTLFFTLITSFINGLQMFDMVFILTQGGPVDSTRTIVFQIYEDGVKSMYAGSASAEAWVLFIIIMGITLFQLRMQKRWVHYE
jgi:multiple sugar transport system permease protein